MLSKKQVIYSLRANHNAGKVIDRIEKSNQEFFTDEEMAKLQIEAHGWDYRHSPAYGIYSRYDNEFEMHEWQRANYDPYTGKSIDIWN